MFLHRCSEHFVLLWKFKIVNCFALPMAWDLAQNPSSWNIERMEWYLVMLFSYLRLLKIAWKRWEGLGNAFCQVTQLIRVA